MKGVMIHSILLGRKMERDDATIYTFSSMTKDCPAGWFRDWQLGSDSNANQQGNH